ncbi:cytochrome P450 [Streptomyces sp. NPDC052013]|uniref:cytochrome P450 n=1 Tax=Streptomyces sp. NPDC052013 TaxID=3365679 RepID=UPI0037D4185D
MANRSTSQELHRLRPGTVGAAPGALPLIGHAIRLSRRPLQFLSELPVYGDLVEIRLGPRRAYMACHPEVVRQLLLTPRTFDKGGPAIEQGRRLVGDGLITSEWASHRRQRRMIQPAFHPARIPGYASMMCQDIEATLGSWLPGRTLDVHDAMQNLALRITTRTLFTTSLSTEAMSEVVECLFVIMRGAWKRIASPVPFRWVDKVPTPENRRFERARTRMRSLVSQIIDQRRTQNDHDDILSLLLNDRDESTGESLNDREIHDQILTLLVAGTETTGAAMAWAFHLLAEHPAVESRLQTELDSVLAGRPPEFEDLPRLPYTARVLTETLRLRPPAWIVTRTTTRETELAGHRLNPGTTVMYSPYLLHHNPDLFPDPEQFDPDRWLPERANAVPHGAMLPFGAGNRKCIGDKFGMTEAALAIATIASRWQLRSAPGTTVRMTPKASLGPGPLPMVPTPRS